MRTPLFQRSRGYGSLARVAKVEPSTISTVKRADFATQADRKYIDPILQMANKYGATPRPIDGFQVPHHDGAGVQHAAFLTKDIVRAVRAITGRGVEFAVTPSSYYDMLTTRLGTPDIPVEALRPLGILVDRDHWGQMYQIFAKSTHIRRTYFLELIDRHGARTFGTNNIPALYAAKERELAEVRDTAGTIGA